MSAITNAVPPEYIRVPKNGERCQHSGLTRSVMLELIMPRSANGYRPPVRSCLLRKPGTARGVRLVHLPSLLAYINARASSEEHHVVTETPADVPNSPEQIRSRREINQLKASDLALRDDFAAWALVGLLAQGSERKKRDLAKDAYELADAMMGARKTSRSSSACAVKLAKAGMSQSAIAAVLGISQGAVSKRLAVAGYRRNRSKNQSEEVQ